MSQILHLFDGMVASETYYNSWPQMRICCVLGHLWILLASRHELQKREAAQSLDMLLNILNRHALQASCTTYMVALRQAARVLGERITAQDR
jgi:hypothetical protein